jgi:signal transduction histidine kinase
VVLALAYLLLLALGWVWLAIEWRDHARSIQQEHQERIYNVSQISAQALMATLMAADDTLIHFKQLWWSYPQSFSQAVQARRVPQSDRPLLELSVIDREGRVVFSTLHPGAVGRDVSDLPHFQAHRDDPVDRMQVHAPMYTRTAQRWMLPISRPLLKPADGSFDGVVVQWVPPDFVAGMYGSTRLHENSTFTVLNIDTGQILMRSRTVRPLQQLHGDLANHTPREFALETQLPPPQKFLSTQVLLTARILPSSGVGSWASSLDQVDRTYAWRKLESQGLMLIVGEPVAYQDTQIRKDLQHQLTAGMVYALLLGLATWSAYRAIAARQRLTQQMHVQLEMARNHRLQLELSESDLRRLSERLTTAGERERSQLAHHIHDELGQRLTVLRIGLARLQGQLKTPGHGFPPEPAHALQQEVSRLVEQVDDCLAEVRRLAESMRPSVLAFGLAPALEALCREFEPAALNGCHFSEECAVHQARAIPPETATTAYRVAQEALSNAARHAEASTLRLRLEWHPDHLLLQIGDDGHGMPTERADRTDKAPRNGLGLVGMRERVYSLGGSLTVHSGRDAGTTLTVRLPLSPTEDAPEPFDEPPPVAATPQAAPAGVAQRTKAEADHTT